MRGRYSAAPLQRCSVGAWERGHQASGNGRCSFRCRHGGARPTNRVAFLLCKTQLSVVRRAVSVLLRLNYFAFWLLPYMAGQTVSVGGQKLKRWMRLNVEGLIGGPLEAAKCNRG